MSARITCKLWRERYITHLNVHTLFHSLHYISNVTSISSASHDWGLEGNFEGWANSCSELSRVEFMHRAVPLFIVERFSFVWNYKYVHKTCTYYLQNDARAIVTSAYNILDTESWTSSPGTVHLRFHMLLWRSITSSSLSSSYSEGIRYRSSCNT